MYASSLFQSLFLQSLLFFIHSHSFNQITSIVYDLDGDLLFADKYRNCVRRYYLTTNTHDEFAGRCGSYGNTAGKQKKRSASQWQNNTYTINNCWNKKLTMMWYWWFVLIVKHGKQYTTMISTIINAQAQIEFHVFFVRSVFSKLSKENGWWNFSQCSNSTWLVGIDFI